LTLKINNFFYWPSLAIKNVADKPLCIGALIND